MSSELRLADRLLTYWNNLKKDSALPDFNHFNASLVTDIWQHCVLFTVAPATYNQPQVVNFYQIGEKLKGVYGSEMAGRSFNVAQKHFPGAAIVRRMGESIKESTALTDIGQFVNERGKVVKYRSCLLPFGKDGRVTHVIVGLSWREF